MTYRTGEFGNFVSSFWVSGIYQAPGIDENLSPNLFSNGASVQFDGATEWSFDSCCQPPPSGVFGRSSDPAPPEDGFIFYNIIEPGLADLLCGEVGRASPVREGTEKSKGAGDIIIGQDL